VFGLIRKPGARSPSTATRRAIETDGLPLGVDRPSARAVVERRGRYQHRSVTYIRIFEPAWARALGVEVRAFDDLDAHPSLILKSGHIEQDGEVVITARASESEPMPKTSLPDDRAEPDGAAPIPRLQDVN
jgi:hypothetical protein